MDEQRRAILDAGQLILREFNDQLLLARRELQDSAEIAPSDTGGSGALRNRLEELQSARQKMGCALQCLYLHSGIHTYDGIPCRTAVERLNEDVLREIFLLVDSAYDHRAFDEVPAFPTAFGLACVCKRWRAVAIASTIIWTKVRLRFRAAIYETLPDRLDTIMERCGVRALDLVVISAPGHNFRDLTRTVMGALSRAFSRSRVIQISWFDNTIRFQGSLLPLLLSNMPVLRGFRVVQHPDGASVLQIRDHPTGLSLLTMCPLLRVLELDHLPLDLIDLPTMPCVEVFSLRSIATTDDLLAMHRAWPGLKRLQLHGVQATVPWEDDATFTQLDTVACLGAGQTLLHVIPRASVPALLALFLKCDSNAVVDAFENFLGPTPFSAIRVLTVAGLCAHRVDRWFPLLPYLVELSMVKVSESGMQTLFLGWTRQNSLLRAPHLRRLTLLDCAFGAPVIHPFMSFITFRTDGVTGPPMRELVVLQGGPGFARDDEFPPWLIPQVERLAVSVIVGVSTLHHPVSQSSWI